LTTADLYRLLAEAAQIHAVGYYNDAAPIEWQRLGHRLDVTCSIRRDYVTDLQHPSANRAFHPAGIS